jgi:UDP:flavonoid glycosyltransferase YjiC (YdhE family)
MRVLMTTTGYPGHLLPLVPFARAFAAGGHDVRVAGPRSHGALAEQLGLRFVGCTDPPAEEVARTVASAAELPVEKGHRHMIAEGFGKVAASALLPDVLRVVDEWHPHAVVSETQELAGPVVAERHGVPHLRVALGLASTDEQTRRLVAEPLNELRVQSGLSPDLGTERIRSSTYLTQLPTAVDPGGPPATHRFRATPTETPPLPDWWAGGSRPLVYLTFGSVAASLGFFPGLYRKAIDSLATLDAHVLVTVGGAGDPAELGAVPSNVHVERWFSQEAVLAQADAIVSHGGYGAMLGALAAGIPQVVLPLFGGDQWANASRLVDLGVGIALTEGARAMFEEPSANLLEALPISVDRVLTAPAFKRSAGDIAAAIANLPPIDSAPDVLSRAVCSPVT